MNLHVQPFKIRLHPHFISILNYARYFWFMKQFLKTI